MAVLFFIVFNDLVDFGIALPLLPRGADGVAASPLGLTLMMVLYVLAQIVCWPFFGRLSDKVGRRPVLLGSLALSAVSSIWLGLADTLWMIFAARLLAGAGAANIAVAQASIADFAGSITGAKSRRLIVAAAVLGLISSPIIGGVAAGSHTDAFVLARPAFAAAGLSMVALLWASTALKESLPAHLRPRVSWVALARTASGRRALRGLVLVPFAAVAIFAAMETAFPRRIFGSIGLAPQELWYALVFAGGALVALRMSFERDYAAGYYSRARALKAAHHYEDALASFDRAIALASGYAEAHAGRATVLGDLRHYEEALGGYEKALALQPDFAEARSSLLFHLNYIGDVSPDAVAAAHRKWDECHAAADTPPVLHLAGAGDPARCLRIGYVSPDFRQHSVVYFLWPLIAAHDRNRVEIFCYSDVAVPDATTQLFNTAADRWVDIAGLETAAVVSRIREDRIDILVDLAGHTGDNRLAVFAQKAAPVQITWLGYPNTTGLAAMDYRITDAIADPPGADRLYSETLIRLPRCFLCYIDDDSLPIADLPVSAAGHITFGSFNTLAKMTPEVVETWARILHAVPDSRLFLKSSTLADPGARERVLMNFADHGILRHRIALSEWIAAPRDHLALYGRIDICLDPFPYNGATTTCQALWMGVPVVTLAGDRHAGRVGASLLTAADLPELIAPDIDAYVAIAVDLARDAERLLRLRAGLRQRLESSQLCDAEGFAQAMENAYRDAWHRRFRPGGDDGQERVETSRQ